MSQTGPIWWIAAAAVGLLLTGACASAGTSDAKDQRQASEFMADVALIHELWA